MIQRLIAAYPGVVVGIGSEIPAATHPLEFRQKFNLRDRFAVYVGRIRADLTCGNPFNPPNQ